ncbi:MAG: MATE family efflux transporter [Peptococcaceae bacterium]|nr:MATE family efflux transporter [Peptococcaceae bacterium]
MKYNWTELKPQIHQVWILSLPAILTQITTIIMQYIDSAMVGALGANASASIGLVIPCTWLFGGVTYAVAVGFSVQVAHRIGAEQDAQARNVVRHGLVAAFLISSLLSLLGILLSKPLPIWLGGDPAICPDATAYFLAFSLMVPFSQLNSLSSSCLQCTGDMLTPSILNAIMCLLDVIFNWIFIPQYGVLGAGIGTALACLVVSIIMAWRCCISNPRLCLLQKEKYSFESQTFKKAFKIGMPVALQEIAMNAAMVAAVAIIAPLGSIAVAANAFAVTAESLCYMPGYGLGYAATTLVGRSVGAGDIKLAKLYGNICTALGALFMGVTGLIMAIICPLVFILLTPDQAVRDLATEVLRIGLIAEPLFGVSIVAAGALRGTGDTFIPSLLNLGNIWLVRISLALLLVERFGLHGMWIAMAIELCVRGLLMLYRQKTSKYYRQYELENTKINFEQ